MRVDLFIISFVSILVGASFGFLIESKSGDDRVANMHTLLDDANATLSKLEEVSKDKDNLLESCNKLNTKFTDVVNDCTAQVNMLVDLVFDSNLDILIDIRKTVPKPPYLKGLTIPQPVKPENTPSEVSY